AMLGSAPSMQPLARKFAELPSLPILVVGDLILDCYIEAAATRVSPEAPVLVFESRAQRQLLGGAGSVGGNGAALGAGGSGRGGVGEDPAGSGLIALMRRCGMDTEAVRRDKGRPTTRKTRFVSRTAQILRVDEEHRQPVDGALAERL